MSTKALMTLSNTLYIVCFIGVSIVVRTDHREGDSTGLGAVAVDCAVFRERAAKKDNRAEEF